MAYYWYSLGVQLGFDPDFLKGLHDPGSSNVSLGLTELLSKWLKQTKFPPTLQSLIDAVGRDIIGHQVKANQLKEQCGDFPSIKGKIACSYIQVSIF